MRSRHIDPEHEEAVARRLAVLGAELSALRDEPTRVKGAPPPPAVVVPVPGRHAARRPTALRPGQRWLRALAERIPGTGLPGLGPVHVALVAVVVALAVGVAAWIAVTSRATPVAVPALASASEPLAPLVPLQSSGTAAATDPTAGGGAALVTVDVAGKVRRPGIVELPAGSRVMDALEAAGGVRRGVDLTPLNRARVLVDGEQILVGIEPVAGIAATLGAPGAPAQGALVNINTADQATLETLPGVGPVTAQAILAWRADNGGFTAVDELLEVSGIGEATLGKLAPLVTI